MSSGDEQIPPEDKGEPNVKAAAKEEEAEGGLLPAILVGAGLLAVVALLLFGGGDDDTGADKSGDKAGAAAHNGAANRADGPGGAAGGVAARPIDDPTRTTAKVNPKINPAVQLPQAGMAPQGRRVDDTPPEGATEAELIAWYEKKLEIAQRMLDQRATFKERLPKIRERIENSDAPERDKQLEAFEGRQKLVEKNYEDAKKKVEDYEAKLAELRGE
jgi:hypothetical protein